MNTGIFDTIKDVVSDAAQVVGKNRGSLLRLQK